MSTHKNYFMKKFKTIYLDTSVSRIITYDISILYKEEWGVSWLFR